MSETQPHEDGEPGRAMHRVSRRDLLRGAGAAGAALGLGGVLAACGTSGDSAGTLAGGTTPSGPVQRGGRMRVAFVGGGKSETFNPARGSAGIDMARFYNTYDPLTRVNPDLTQSPGLALEWNPSSDGTSWEVKLRPDVVWHDGKDFTADDVIYTLRQMGDPQHVGHSSVSNVRLGEVKKLGPLALRIPLTQPDARLSDSFVLQNTVIVQDGARDFSHPVGTGPFKFESFAVGERSLSSRNPNYWEDGRPYLDELEIISIDDGGARLNALLAGQLDAMVTIPLSQARAHEAQGDIAIVNAPSIQWQVMLMAVDVPPFDDPRVRQAFRLIADRQALVDGALVGYGVPANDLFGKGLPYFADDLPVRDQDLEQARSLLKQAGREDLTVTLHTSGVNTGFIEAATLFAEQAKGAGVTVNVKREQASAFFDTSLLYTHLDFASSTWNAGSLSAWYSQALMSDATWNETHWRVPSYDKLVSRAIGATDVDAATDLWHQVQQIQYDRGGYIGWANGNNVDATSKHVQGMVPSAFVNLGGLIFQNVWLDR